MMTTHQPRIWTRALVGCTALLVACALHAADSIPKPDEIIRRYIPSARLDAVSGKDAPGALLPIAEFEALLKEAAANAGTGDQRPTGAALVKADYALRIQAERLLATCRITVRSFDRNWQTLTLPVQGLSVLSARFEGVDAQPQLARDPKQPEQLRIFLADPGTHTLVLELSTPLASAGGDSAAAFHLVNAPLGELTLSLPAGKQLRLDGLLLARPAADDQPADFQVAIGGRPEVRLVITDRKAIDRTDAMTFASTAFGVIASPGEATWTALTRLSVFGRPLDKLECEFPSALEITDVESQGLEAWQLSDAAPGRTRLTLTWRQPFDGLRPITFRGVFAPDRDGRRRVPSLTLQNISSHTGSLILQRPAGVRLQVTSSTGVRPVAAEGQPATTPDSVESRFEIWKEDFALEFIPAAKDREVQAAMSTLLALGSQGADLTTTIDLETRFAPLFEVDIQLPASWQVLEARHSGQPAEWQLIPDQAGRNTIRVPLVPPLSPGKSRTLSLAAHLEPEGWPVAAVPIRMTLPEVRLPQAGVVEALYGITADPDLEVVPFEISGLIPARQADVDTLNRQLAAFHRTVRLGFTYQDTVFTGQLEVRRLPARLTATCITLTRIDAEEVASHVEAQLTITGGGVRELTVRLPESVGRQLRFSLAHFQPRPIFGPPVASPATDRQAVAILPPLPMILEQTAGAAENGQIPWTIKLDRYASGTLVLQAELSQPRATAAAGSKPQWTVPAMTIVGADRESGAIGIEAADDQHIEAVANDAAGQSLERVDPIDFPPAHTQPRERLVAAFAYERPGWVATVTENRLTRISMPTAVIQRIELASIIGIDGVKQVQADATLSAVGVQSLVVKLPPEHLLWGALVDGSPVLVHKSGELLSVPLSSVEPPGRARQIRLIYAPVGDSAGVRKQLGGFALNESPPEFHVVTGQGTTQALTVLSSQWTVHHAADLDMVAADGVFRPSNPLQRDSLIHRLLSLFRLPGPSDATWRFAILGVIVVVLWLFTTAKRRLSTAMLGCLLVMVSVALVSSTLLLKAPRDAFKRSSGVATTSITSGTPAPMAADKPGYVAGAEPNLNFDADHLFRHTADPSAKGVESFEFKQNRRQAQPAVEAEIAGRMIHTPKPDIPIAEPQAPQDEAFSLSEKLTQSPFQAERGRKLVRGEGLLSVTFGLEPPAGSRSVVLETTADQFGTASRGLAIRFMDERTRQLWMCFAAIAVTICGWWLRHARLLSRLMFLLLTLLGPITLRWLIPLSWLPLADGVWLGGVATAGLWLVRSLCLHICSCPCLAGLCKPRSSVAAAAAFAAILSMSGHAVAQETAARKAPVPPQPDTVFIPYDNVREPLTAKNVFVPQALFLKLWRAAHPDDAPLANPPLSSTVAAAAFVVDLTGLPEVAANGGASARSLAPVTARFVLNNLTAAPVRLQLPIQGIAIRSATLNGMAAILDSQTAGQLVVTLPETGSSILDLQFDIPVDRTGPAGRFQFENTSIAAGLLTVKLPKSEVAPEVRVGGSKVSTSSTAVDGPLAFEIPIDRGGAQQISWQPTASRSGDDSPVQVQATTSVVIDDTGLTARSTYSAKVSQSGIAELPLAFPGSMRLKRVEGADVGGWRIEGENAGRRLIVFFSRKIESQTTFVVETFQPVAVDERQQSVTIVPPQPEGVSRETGKIGVFVAPQLSVRPGTVTGLTQEDLAKFEAQAAPAGTPLQLAYRYAARPISLELILQRRQAETRASVEHGLFVTQRKLRLSTRCRFQVAGAPRSTLSLLLPPDYLLLDVTSPVLADYSTSADDAGRKILTVELDQPRTGEIELLLNGAVPRRPEEPSTVVVAPRVLDVSKVDSQLGIWVEDLYVATADALGDWKNADPNSLDAPLRALRPTAMQFGFRSVSLDPQPLTLGLRTQSAELSADVLSLIAVSDASIDYGFTLQWRITRAATDTFSFTTPGWLRGRIDFAGVGVRQVTSADLPGDRVKWTVSLTDPVRESYLLTGAAALPYPAEGRVLAPEITFESGGAGGAASRLEAQRQFAVVVNLSRRPLALENPAAVEIVRREALPLKVPDQLVRQAMNIVQVIPGRTASWLARRVQTTDSLQATITGAKLETVVEVDGSWRTQATYTLRNRGRQYLPLDLSAMGRVRVLSILVKGKPARALETTVGGKSLHLVPLPPSSAADLSYDVVAMLAGSLPQGLPKETSIVSAKLELPAPHITTPAESPAFGMPVAQTAWVVRLPDGVEAEIDDSGNLTAHQAGEWELLAGAQTLSQLEADTEEMLRIVADRESSEQRRIQAWYNLNTLSDELDNNRRQIDEVAQRAESRLGEKGVELWGSNLSRNGMLKAKVVEQLRAGENGREAGPHTSQPARMVPLPQLQGSLNLNSGGSMDQQGVDRKVLNAPQATQGRAYILGNSFDILNSNSVPSAEAKDGLSVEFGFSAPQVRNESAKSQQSEAASKATSRSGLKRKLAEQQQAPSDPSESSLGLGRRILQPQGGLGGVGGGAAPSVARPGQTLHSDIPASGRVDLTLETASPFVGQSGDAAWTSGAGLSLAMTLPPVGDDALAFSKVGGDPKLVLKTRSAQAKRAAWSLAEVALALIAALWLLSAATARGGFARTAASAVAMAAAVSFLLLPGGMRWLALLLFVAAAITIARKPQVAKTSLEHSPG